MFASYNPLGENLLEILSLYAATVVIKSAIRCKDIFWYGGVLGMPTSVVKSMSTLESGAIA